MMKMMRYSKKIAIPMLVVCLAVGFVSCSEEEAATESPNLASGPNRLVLVGAKTGTELRSSMIQLTGIDPASGTTSCTDYVPSRLPDGSSAGSTMGKLKKAMSVVSCVGTFVANGTGGMRSTLFPGVNFSAGAASISSNALKGSVSTLLSRSLGRKPEGDELPAAIKVANDFLALSPNTTAGTQGWAVRVFTAIVASAVLGDQ